MSHSSVFPMHGPDYIFGGTLVPRGCLHPAAFGRAVVRRGQRPTPGAIIEQFATASTVDGQKVIDLVRLFSGLISMRLPEHAVVGGSVIEAAYEYMTPVVHPVGVGESGPVRITDKLQLLAGDVMLTSPMGVPVLTEILGATIVSRPYADYEGPPDRRWAAEDAIEIEKGWTQVVDERFPDGSQDRWAN